MTFVLIDTLFSEYQNQYDDQVYDSLFMWVKLSVLMSLNTGGFTKLDICWWTISSISRADSTLGLLASPNAYLEDKGYIWKIYE
jgi:hypothetical protein